MDVEFISKQQALLGAEMRKNPANPRQFLDALGASSLVTSLARFQTQPS
jgi:hypothetical protein